LAIDIVASCIPSGVLRLCVIIKHAHFVSVEAIFAASRENVERQFIGMLLETIFFYSTESLTERIYSSYGASSWYE